MRGVDVDGKVPGRCGVGFCRWYCTKSKAGSKQNMLSSQGGYNKQALLLVLSKELSVAETKRIQKETLAVVIGWAASPGRY